jgi:hypothetical protein
MKITLTKRQIEQLVESNIFYGDDRLPSLIEDINKDVIQGNKVCGKFLTMLKSLNIGEVMDNPSQYLDYVKNMKRVNDVFRKKSNDYYGILDTFDNDYGNKQLQEFDNLNHKLVLISDDMDTIINNFTEIVENVIDVNGSVKNSFTRLTKEYPGETIEMNEQDARTLRAATEKQKCGLDKLVSKRTETGGGEDAPTISYKDWWDEMTNTEKHPDLNNKENRSLYKDFKRQHSDVSFEIFLALKRDSERFSGFNQNVEYNKYFDNSGNVIKGQESNATIVMNTDPWFVYYRKVFGGGKRVSIEDMYNHYSKNPNGINSFKETVKKFYR